MNTEEVIKRRGLSAYEKKLEQTRVWLIEHPEEHRAGRKKWERDHPEKAAAHRRKHHKTGIQGLKNKVRTKDADYYRPYKKIIAPGSQKHHAWKNNGTAEFDGVGLVEADQYMHGFDDVIQVLHGEICLFTEASLQGREEATQW